MTIRIGGCRRQAKSVSFPRRSVVGTVSKRRLRNLNHDTSEKKKTFVFNGYEGAGRLIPHADI
jgi:hypothetical protein